MAKRWISAIFIIILGIFLAACSSGDAGDQNETEIDSLVQYETPTPTLEFDDPTPVIEPTIPPTATPTPFLYTVEARDTMYVIAYIYNLTLDQLIAANPSIDPRFLSIGMQLEIPYSESGSGIDEPTPVAVEFESRDPKCYLTLIKDAWCFWLIENNTSAAYENVSARFRLYDQDGVEITTEIGMIPINRLNIGEKMPIIAYFPPEVPEWSLVQVQIETLLQSPEDTERYLPIELLSSQVEMGEGDLYAEVLGTVKLRDTDRSASIVWAAVTAYDDRGDVVGSRRWESDGLLESGAEMELAITIYSLSRPIDHIEIILEARP
jgi:LysM repeat protein